MRQRREENLSGRANVAKVCGHGECALDLTQCCSCADRREERDTDYLVYVDGEGMKAGNRWSFYCDVCKDRYREAELDSIVAMSSSGDPDNAASESSHARRRARVLANYQRVFGSREEIAEQEYESPIGMWCVFTVIC